MPFRRDGKPVRQVRQGERWQTCAASAARGEMAQETRQNKIRPWRQADEAGAHLPSEHDPPLQAETEAVAYIGDEASEVAHINRIRRARRSQAAQDSRLRRMLAVAVHAVDELEQHAVPRLSRKRGRVLRAAATVPPLPMLVAVPIVALVVAPLVALGPIPERLVLHCYTRRRGRGPMARARRRRSDFCVCALRTELVRGSRNLWCMRERETTTHGFGRQGRQENCEIGMR